MLKTPSFRLDGKRALATGASSGIGQAAAVALGEYGAHVTLMARRADKLAETQKMIEDVGGTAESLPADVADVKAIEQVIAGQEPFDILLNAAGVARHSVAFDTSEEDFDTVADLNYKGAYFLSCAVAKKLIEAKKPGSLIHISSQLGHVGSVERALYSSSKHAVEGMTKSMAIEWGAHQVRVNTISPTFILTALTQSTFDNPEWLKRIESKIKLGRVGQVEDIMGAVIYLASDASALVTGTSILVDGGWTAE